MLNPADATLAWSIVPPEVGEVALFLLFGMLSALLIGVAKAGFGGSIGLLSMPIMIYACGGKTALATGIMLPILIVCDQVAMAAWWRRWSLREAGRMLAGAVAGIAAGGGAVWAFRRLDSAGGQQVTDAGLKLLIGAISLLFVALQLAKWLRGRSPALRPVAWQGACAGALAGFTSTLAHAGGPVTTMYLLPQQMPKGRYVATTVLFYWANNLLKLVPFGLLGLIDGTSLRASGVLLPAVVVGALVGVFLHRRVPQRPFTGIVYVLLTLAGADLAIKAVRSLWF